jgi:uncharacterized membrane protein YhaH (DUF805 family)
MLGFLFGFNARLGRLHFFLASLVLGIVMVALCFAIGAHFYNNKSLSIAQMAWPLIWLGIIFLISSLSLQCMRIRDIGWDPVCVMPTWIAISIVDHLIATKFPALSYDPLHTGTVVGGLLNIGMWLALLFWPSAQYVMRPPSFDFPSEQPDPPPRRGGESAASSRMARVANGGFGRRSG